MTKGRASSLSYLSVLAALCTWSILLALRTDTRSNLDPVLGCVGYVKEDPEGLILMRKFWKQKKSLEKQAPAFICDDVDDQKMLCKST